jgi:hypothetical protein
VPDLENPLAKIERAKEHFEALDREIDRLNSDNPSRVRHYEDAEKSLYVVRIEIPIVPRRFGILAGDAIYNLRAALDQLAWQLALLRVERPFSRTEFPIVDEDTPGNRAHFRRVTQDIPAGACARINTFQPYRRGAAYKDDPLWQLDKLRNIDAHRLIPVHAITVNMKAPVAANVRLETFDDYAVMTLPLAFKPQMQLAPLPTTEIVFGSEIDGLVVPGPRLGEIYEFVASRVVPRFARFFPKAPKP